MPQPKNRRWIFAVLLVILFPAAAVHFSCVAVLGPGNWGSGVEEKAPELLPAAPEPRVQAYAREFAQPVLPRPGWTGYPRRFEGHIFWVDYFEEKGLWAVQTYEGSNWTEQQHVYFDSENYDEPKELSIAGEMIVERPVLMKKSGDILVVYGRWNPWGISAVKNIVRYLKSYFDPRLRSEFSLYIWNPARGTREYFGAGRLLKASPDREKAVFLRSGALGTTLHSIHVWELHSGKVETVLSLTEVEPGSELPFDYRWSADSRAIQISGKAGGFRSRANEPREVNLIYLVDRNQTYKVR